LDFNESKFREKYNRYEIEISTLTFKEINLLQKFDIDFDLKDGRYKYVRDIFIFMCYTSLRYSDICTLSKDRDIDNNGKAIDKILQKTKKFKSRATIPLNETTQGILKKYDYKLDRYSNAMYNRYLTEFFQKAGFFQENFFPRKFIGGEEINCNPIPRYKALTSHAGRRTCITNLINLGYHPLQIMPMTGHKSEKMLIKYYDKYRNKGIEAIKMLDKYDHAVNSSNEIKLNSKNNPINNAK
jgi:integrase